MPVNAVQVMKNAPGGVPLGQPGHDIPSKKNKRRNRHKKNSGELSSNSPMKENARGPPVGANSRAPLDPSHPSNALLDRLADMGIFPIKNQRSAHNPKALYYCRLCAYHCDNVDRAEQHGRGSRHIMKQNNRDMREFLSFIPKPLDFHVHHLSTSLLLTEARSCLLKEAELKRRLHIFEDVKKHLEDWPDLKPNLRLSLFGSMVHGFITTNSDVNINVIDVKDRRQLLGRLLLQSYNAMCQYNNLKNLFVTVEEHFMGAYPYFAATDSCGIHYKFSVNNSNCADTNQLIRVYRDLDDRCLRLGLLFRRLGKLAHMDNQEVGTFPAISFPLMVIHFLQQTSPPVLPVLQELPKSGDNVSKSDITEFSVDGEVLNYVHKPAKYWKSFNTQTLGELWLDMLRYYAVDFNYEANVVSVTHQGILKKSAKTWKHRRISIEDPMYPKRDLGRSLGMNDVMDYVLLQLRTAYRYFAVPQTESGPLFRYVKRRAVDMAGGQPGTGKNKHLHLTPLFNPAEHPRSIATRLVTEMKTSGRLNLGKDEKMTDESRERGMSLILRSLGDAICHQLGVAVSLSDLNVIVPNGPIKDQRLLNDDVLVDDLIARATSVYDTIIKCYLKQGVWDLKRKNLRNLLRRFLISRPIVGTSPPLDSSSPESTSIEALAGLLVEQVVSAAIQSVDDENQGNRRETADLDDDDDENEEEEKMKADRKGIDNKIFNIPILPGEVEECDVPGYLNSQLYHSLSPEQLVFNFDCGEMLGDSRPPELRCGSCNRVGHLRDSCPDDDIDFRDVRLPIVGPADLRKLSDLLKEVPHDFMETDYHRQQRCTLLNDISQALKKTQYQTARLEMFGSCVNGFGFHTSDVDICMSFNDKDGKPMEFTDKEVRNIVVDICKIMKKTKRFFPCRAIAQAKVPIVKFQHRSTHQEGDLSLNNRLALQNTRLLLFYCCMDERVKTLGFVVKILAKLCNIGDASRGSLSSYAYIILMLHFLIQEGVIPCLQEMYPPGKQKPVLMIEGWDAWFNDDEKYVMGHWKPSNNKSVGELWLGFLTYYTQLFNWRQQVVTIKQTTRLHRLEKLWTQAHLAIEDPFDLNHNLGCGLSKKMATYIQRVFFKAAVHFRSRLTNVHPSKYKDYLFDPNELSRALGPAPRDRGCKVCGVIRHIARDCPNRRNRTKSQNEASEYTDDGEGLGDDDEKEEEEEEEVEEDEEEEEEEEEDADEEEEVEMEDDEEGNMSLVDGELKMTPTSSVQGQLIQLKTVTKPVPPPIVYIPAAGPSNGPGSSISVRPLMMTVNNRDIAVPVATLTSPEALSELYHQCWTSSPQIVHGLPRLELDPNQDPCILSVGQTSNPVSMKGPPMRSMWPSPQVSQAAMQNHKQPPLPLYHQTNPSIRSAPKQSPMSLHQAQISTTIHQSLPHPHAQQARDCHFPVRVQPMPGPEPRPAYISGMSPGQRSRGSPGSPQIQQQPQQPSYSRVLSSTPYGGDSHTPNSHGNPPGPHFGLQHRHNFPRTGLTQSTPVQQQQQQWRSNQQQPYGHPGAPPGHQTSPYKGVGGKRRG